MYSKQTELILKLIKEGKTLNQICAIMNITNSQFYIKLKNLEDYGFKFKRFYYSNGEIIYYFIKNIEALDRNNTAIISRLLTDPDENDLKAMVISDLHYGNEKSRVDLINKVYNYCINKNIKIIFICGDIVDGVFSKEKQNIKDPFEQIKYFIKNYPFDKNIINFAVCGDHDYSVLTKTGQNMIEMLRNFRHDIVINNYHNAYVEIKNDRVLLNHKGLANVYNPLNLPCSVVLKGHYHNYAYSNENDILNLSVPPLSEIGSNVMPTALEINLHFEKGLITRVNSSQLLFGFNNYYVLNELVHTISNNQNVENKPISNLVKFSKVFGSDVSKLENDNLIEEILNDDNNIEKPKVRQLTQIEKFNKKYNLN